MSYRIPTIDEQHRRMLDIRRAVMPAADTSEGGTFYRDDRVIALALGDLHEHLDAVDRDSNPATAEGAALERWGEKIVSVERNGATASARSAALQIRGTAGVPVLAGTTLTARNTGIRVEIAATAVLSGGGTVLADVVSIDKGTQANLPVNTVLDFDAPPAGVNQSAKLVLALEGAVDAEEDGPYRDRVVNRFNAPPQGGNRNDWVQWALLVAGVDSAYALRFRNGLGTVDMVGLRNGTGTARMLSGSVRGDIETTIDELRPLSTASFRVLETTAEVVTFVVEVTPLAAAQYSFDWDDSAGLEVSTYNATTRVVTTTTDLPTSFGAGDRLVFAGDGRVFIASAVVSVNQFVLGVLDEEDLDYAPSVTGLDIYAAGPLTAPIREAVLNGYLAADGSTIPGVNQLGPANEEARYGDWIDTVEETRVAAAAQSVPGVYRAMISDLRVDGVPVVGGIARPSDPAVPGAIPSETTTIGVLVAGAIVVRRAT